MRVQDEQVEQESLRSEDEVTLCIHLGLVVVLLCLRARQGAAGARDGVIPPVVHLDAVVEADILEPAGQESARAAPHLRVKPAGLECAIFSGVL